MQTKDFLREAYSVAMEYSDDPSTWVGAVIISEQDGILASSANRYMGDHTKRDNYEYPERFQSPEKYNWIEHAERGAVYALGRRFFYDKPHWKLPDFIMYAPWAACIDCARAIVLAKIKKLVIHKQAMDRTPPNWTPNLDKAFEILRINSVEIEIFDEEVGDCINLMQGKIWYP